MKGVWRVGTRTEMQQVVLGWIPDPGTLLLQEKQGNGWKPSEVGGSGGTVFHPHQLADVDTSARR